MSELCRRRQSAPRRRRRTGRSASRPFVHPSSAPSHEGTDELPTPLAPASGDPVKKRQVADRCDVHCLRCALVLGHLEKRNGSVMLTYLQILMNGRLAKMDERGASAVEYGLLIAGIAALIVAVVFLFGGVLNNLFSSTCNTVGQSAGQTC